jgi:hypothetical protein
MKELSFAEVYDLCKKYNIKIKGIYCRDQIPNNLKNEWIIINLFNHTGGGTHYTAFYCGTDINMYFDSFGFPAINEIDKFGQYIYNDLKLQDLNSESCGWFCLACIRFCEKYGNSVHSFKEFLSQFTDKSETNERIHNHIFH